MRGRSITLQQAMELVYYNDRWGVVLRTYDGQYTATTTVAAVDLPVEMVFATRDQVRAAIQEAGGDYFRAGQALTAAWEERARVVSIGNPDETTPE